MVSRMIILGRIRGIWFYVDSDCLKIANLMKKLIEGGKFTVGAKSQSATQIATQPHQPYKFGQPKVAGQDILSILSKATTEYDARGNSTQNQSPPVDGHMIIKPTPVRIQNGRPPTEIVRMEVAGPSRQPLTVAELFGSKNGEENGRPNRQSSNGSIISTIEAPVVPDLLQRLLSSSNSESLLSSISSGSRVGELEKKLRTTQFVPKSTATESQKSEQKPNSSHPPVTQSFSDFIFDNSEDLKVPITSSHLLKPLSMNTDVDADMVKFFLPSPLSPPLQADCGIVASATPLITPIDLLNCQSSEGSAAPSHCGDGMATPNADNSLTLDIETSALNYSLDNNNDLMPIGENNTIAPLTKGQMVQAFRYLLKVS